MRENVRRRFFEAQGQREIVAWWQEEVACYCTTKYVNLWLEKRQQSIFRDSYMGKQPDKRKGNKREREGGGGNGTH